MNYERLWADRKDQRTVEYPFVFENLPHLHTLAMNPKPRILDVGCCETELCMVLHELGKYEVYAIDIRSYDTHGMAINFTRGDIRTPVFPPDFFDVVLAISTIEHVGLDWYENTWLDPDGDVRAMEEIRRILKPYGVAIVTVDVGQKGEHWFRAYTEETLERLTRGWRLEKIRWFEKRDGWVECSGEEASRRESKEYADACACMVLRRD